MGKPIKGGNNLVIDTIHEDAPQIPLRMAPMVLIGTVLTHLFGGSAGREGTAVQMGASVADAIAHRFRVGRDLRRIVIAAGRNPPAHERSGETGRAVAGGSRRRQQLG